MMTFKQRLQSDASLYGTWVRIAHPTMVELLGRSGFDFLHIDMEHGPIGNAELDAMLLAAQATGTPALVRVPQLDSSLIGRALDLGAAGVVVPRINDAKDALAAVQAAYFAPVGHRGLGGACRANGYGATSFQEFAAEANGKIVLALQIETKQAVEQIDEILEVSAAATDLYFIGPADLSQSLGVAGQFDHPLLQETIQWVVKRIKKRGKAVGIHLPNPSMVQQYADLGIQYFTSSFDIGIVSDGAKGLLKAMQQPGRL
jgi:2-keto-3-deoxy-L-rhamnonate aldolase RhmA